MFLRAKTRRKDGKPHRYWSVVENRRVRGGGRVIQRQLLHLGELNDRQRAGWVRTIKTLATDHQPARQLALFPDDRDESSRAGLLNRPRSSGRDATAPAVAVRRLLAGAGIFGNG